MRAGIPFEEVKAELLADEKVRKEYENLEPEFQIIRAMIEARNRENLTQQELADRIGINRADLSRLENGNANPSLRTLKRIAEGLGLRLKLEFVPK